MKKKVFISLMICMFFTLIISILLIKYVDPISNKNTPKNPSYTNDDKNITPTPAIEITPEPTAIVEITPTTTPTPIYEPVVMTFAGDILFDDNSKPIAKYNSVGKGLEGVLSKNLIAEMNNADIMMLNNEFPYSTRGKKLPDKTYTFRAHPDKVNILHDMGVDIVSLANNHALDYGPDALLDTFDTLENADIPYVGAGRNLDQAKGAVYLESKNRKIAFLSASRVIYADNWYAKEDRPGMLGIYDPSLLIDEIRKTKGTADYIVVFVHWGIESNNYPEEYQRNMAKQFIDAGADIIIGAHPHVMQGFEFYKDKPIIYSLGNFWFSSYSRESGLLKVTLNPDNCVDLQILPVYTGNCYTYLSEDASEIKKYNQLMQKFSFDVKIDDKGYILPE